MSCWSSFNLKHLCLEQIAKIMATCSEAYLNELEQNLPSILKQKLLVKFTASNRFWGKNKLSLVLPVVIDDRTPIINFSSFPVTNEIIEKLDKCRNVQRFIMHDDQLTSSDDLKKFFKNNTKLCLLDIVNSNVFDDDVLEIIAENCPNLMGIHLVRCPRITDEGITKLVHLKHLTYLAFSYLNITDYGLKRIIIENGVQLKEISVQNCPKLTEGGLRAIPKCCPLLETLSVKARVAKDKRNKGIPDMKLKNLKQLFWDIY